MNHENLQRVITNFLKENDAWSRAVSLDIEADLRTLDNPSKIILSISTARRVGETIDVQKFVLDKETMEDEGRIFNEFGLFCQTHRPLIFIGYNIMRFDLPILLVKMRKLDETFKKEGRYSPSYWAFRESLGRSYFLDMMDPTRFEIGRFDNSPPKMISLENAISHKRFEQLPFKRTKNVISDLTSTGMNKWDAVYKLWKENKADFNRYIEGDVHDTLVLAEDLFGMR